MTYDEGLADRIRDALEGQSGITEKRMFGGLAFLLDGRMTIVANRKGEAMVRVDPETADELHGPGVSATVMRGREMRGWLDLGPEALASDIDLRTWIRRSLDFAATLPEK